MTVLFGELVAWRLQEHGHEFDDACPDCGAPRCSECGEHQGECAWDPDGRGFDE